MKTSLDRKPVASFIVLGVVGSIVSVFLACSDSDTPVNGAPGQGTSSQQGTVVSQLLNPTLLASTTAIQNPTSGFFETFPQNAKTMQLVAASTTNEAPFPGNIYDYYSRLSWHSLEPQEGQFNFAIIDNFLSTMPKGVRFSFRIMALNPQYNLMTNVYTANGITIYSDSPSYLDSEGRGWYLPIDPTNLSTGSYFIPDWNDPVFLTRVGALLSALGQKYDGDPRIGSIDIGLYGSWGEWHTAGLPSSAYHGIPYTSSSPYYSTNTQAYQANHGVAGAYAAGTDATKEAIINAHYNNFQKTQLLTMTDDGHGVCYALGLSSKIGMRRDSFGSSLNSFYYLFPNQLVECNSATDITTITTRWQTAPFVAEPFGNGSSSTNLCQTFESFQPSDSSDTYNCSVAKWNGGVPDFCVNEQVLDFHISNINNHSLCTAPWAQYSTAEQQAFVAAGASSGYRYAPVSVQVSPSAGGVSIAASWSNSGIAPTYIPWSVQFLLTNSAGVVVGQTTSSIDLRTVLPGSNSSLITDTISVSVMPGTYQLSVSVIDPGKYLLPMQLTLAATPVAGVYPLGSVQFK